jgi:dipeptidase D
MSPDAARTILDLLLALPSGVLSMDERLPGIVRTSTNLGVVYLENDDVVAGLGAAVIASQRPGTTACSVCQLCPARRRRADVTSRYPAWQPDSDSKLLEVVRVAHVEVYGREPQ